MERREWFSYAQWCDCLGTAAGWYAARIAFGPETHAAYMSGITPGAYGKKIGTRKGPRS